MIDNESRLQVQTDENGPHGESVCSSGYGSNGTSEVAFSSANEDACSLRSCSTEETPDHPLPQPALPVSSANEGELEEDPIPAPAPIVTNGTVVRRPKTTVDKLTALKAHRASCPTTLAISEPFNLNSSFGSAHSSSSNVSIERLTATDDEVRLMIFNDCG